MVEKYKEHLLKQGFELQEQIGLGLSGRTFKGFQTTLKRPVAVKFFDNKFNDGNNVLKKKFLRESLLLADLPHPSIPYVLTRGSIKFSDSSIPYIVMQYISGSTLSDYIKEHAPIPLETALNISVQVLDALSFVHQKNIVHRDIKPSNIMVLPSGHCYVIDFSIGFKIDPQAGMTRATRTGDHLGSLVYMSPEQKQDMKNVDQRSDVFSYALVLCEMLSGKPELQSLSQPKNKYPAALIKAIENACCYDKEDRYSNAQEFLRDLRQVSSKSLPFLDTPSKAICNNTLCPSANWSSRGYYKGAYFIEESTSAYCTSCGNKLVYQCENCGSSIDNTEYCGGCGAHQFEVPECLQCGSFLKKSDMIQDTKKNGCEKCRATKSQEAISATIVDDGFDDIPF
jgi:eukaryotic-like serine/threonine-protein kinase